MALYSIKVQCILYMHMHGGICCVCTVHVMACHCIHTLWLVACPFAECVSNFQCKYKWLYWMPSYVLVQNLMARTLVCYKLSQSR